MECLAGSPPYTKNQLKEQVYGTDRPSLELEVRVAGEAARKLGSDPETLRRSFPGGFGSLMNDMASWR
jgi:hypothetical protein